MLFSVVPGPLFLGDKNFFPPSHTPAWEMGIVCAARGVGTLLATRWWPACPPAVGVSCPARRDELDPTCSGVLAASAPICNEVTCLLLVKQRMLSQPWDMLCVVAPLARSPHSCSTRVGGSLRGLSLPGLCSCVLAS